MTSRKRNHPLSSSFETSRNVPQRRSPEKKTTRKKRRHLLETLEPRQLLAGPQLIGIQPNEGDLIVDGTVRDTAPRVLTFRFDQDQVINEGTFEGIRLTRAGDDGALGTSDDIVVTPGLTTLGENAPNEVVVRFADALPNDKYRAEVFGFDDAGLGITALRNVDGEALQPRSEGRVDATNFELRLGALIESVVPQPVIRLADGSLSQNRNEIVVYFNEDPLFVEDVSASGAIRIGDEEVTINATSIDRSFDDVQIRFNQVFTGNTTASFDASQRTLTINHPPITTFTGIASAVSVLPEFSASVTAGNGNEIFTPPNGDVRFEIKGTPSQRSAENPRYYQLLLTQDTVRTTDDSLYYPDEVIYDPATFTARLFFNRNADGSPVEDINQLGPDRDGNPGVPISGGTFRMRIGTAVDERMDVILPPIQTQVAPSALTDFGIEDFLIKFESTSSGEGASGFQVIFEDSGSAGLSARLEPDAINPTAVVIDFGGSNPNFAALQDIIANTPGVQDALTVSFQLGGVAGDGDALPVPRRVIGAAPLTLNAVGDTLGTALDVGIFGSDSELTSLVFSESIQPQNFAIELPGGNGDPGRLEIPEALGGGLIQYVNSNFGSEGADILDGITEISYNFEGIFARSGGDSFLNQINDRQKQRIREALNLWSSVLGIQFRETVDQGITFALGDTNRLQATPGTRLVSYGQLNASLRIDPRISDPSIADRSVIDPAIVFSNQFDFGTAYGEDFLRKAMAGIGFILGLEQAPGLTSQTLMTLTSSFLNATIDPAREALIRDIEPVFPSNYDTLHGQFIHRPESTDVDLYRFEVNLGDSDRLGTLTAETFAERLPDSSSLDTTLTLFREVKASKLYDFGVGPELSVRFDSLLEGELGNNTRIDFVRSNRGDVSITRPSDNSGVTVPNAITVDLPRTAVSARQVIDAINNDSFASTLLRASIEGGDENTNVSEATLNLLPVLLAGGKLQQLARNDDYFSEDSRIIADLSAGTYYVGVASSGNDTYDPTITDSGFGGLTQGAYDLHLKFEPQVDEVDVIRDLDGSRANVPGTAIDGDGDGTPGGLHNFWFQTRGLDRRLTFTNNGDSLTVGQTVTVVGGNDEIRTYEFVPAGVSTRPGNVPVIFNPGTTGFPTPASALAQALITAINANDAGARVTLEGTSVVFNGNDNQGRILRERSLTLSNDFRGAEISGRTIFVDKAGDPLADGSLDRPFNNIANPAVANAFGSARAGDTVRIVGNGGLDDDITTEADNFSYQVGTTETGGQVLEDGRNLEIPRGVTTVIDAGAVFKMRGSRISVGSSTLLEDRSGGALQVLGTPRLVQLSAFGEAPTTSLIGEDNQSISGYSDGSVIFTSVRDRAADLDAAGIASSPAPGDWGGLVFRRDLDETEGRSNLEDEGIFLQYVNHAQLRYGGGSNLLIDSVQQLVNPIQIFEMRPTVTFNEISFSADAAISASPDSFEETSFQSIEFQQGGAFTADYTRVGPAIHNNAIDNNSINGLFIRVVTAPDQAPKAITTAARFDDIDVVHYVAENIFVEGTPGGSLQDGVQADLVSTALVALTGGTLRAGTYDYRLTFVDRNGFESLASDPSASITVPNDSSINLVNLTPVPNDSDYLARRLYRLDPSSGEYLFVARLDASDGNFTDNGQVSSGTLDLSRQGIRGRLDASLVVDPGLVMKFRGSRIELGQSTQLLAEGLASDPIIFTSYADDRFGSGGTFNTNNDSVVPGEAREPNRGDWSGIYAGPTSVVSLDHATIAFGGGVSLLEGGQSRGFAPLELQQANGRVTNSRFEENDDGQDGAGPVGRFGLLAITPSTIFVRGSQPVIVGNSFIDNRGSIIDIDSDSMTAQRLVDIGRQTGSVDRFSQLDDNYGPLIRLNRYEIVANGTPDERQISGLEIAGGVLSTESVWDDTDIVHLLFDEIEVQNIHSSGGLRLISRSDESLVVKLDGAGSPVASAPGTGLTASGSLTNIEDRIGGAIQIVGMPGRPVVLTSFSDDTVGAGLTPGGEQFTDNNGDSFGSRAEPNDWRGILFDEFSHDRNIDYVLEQTLTNEVAPGLNGTFANAQVLGGLAANQVSGDEQVRLGYEIEGFLSADNDIDTYSFTAEAGTRIWIDVDRTSFNLDSVVEVLDANGNVLARSDNSFSEVAGEPLEDVDPLIASVTRSLNRGADSYTEFGAGGLYQDFGSTNPRDAGIQLSLPGNRGTRSVYFFRVRSDSVNPDDSRGGLTHGGYRVQLRLQEAQELPGNLVRYADIRYANHGVHVRGVPSSSPLLGEAQENEAVAGTVASNNSLTTDPTAPGRRAQYLGNLLVSEDKVFSVGGELSQSSDIDFYQIDVFGNDLQTTTIFDIDYADGFNRPDTSLLVFYDADGETGSLPPRLVLIGEGSNVVDDQAQPISRNQLDLLSRGSVSANDPLIGPISLTDGTYYVAVVGAGVTADALSSITTRREPIESIARIFEDHIESVGGSTALPPREANFFNSSTLPPGWSLTTNRATDAGHQQNDTFNGSRGDTFFPTSFQNENSAAADSFFTAQNLSTGDATWSLAEDPDIGSFSQNTSQTIPHTTVRGSTINDIVDIYRVEVPDPGPGAPSSTVIFDIDNGFNPLTSIVDDLPDDVDPVEDLGSIDLKLQVFDIGGNIVGSNSFALTSFGALGSESNQNSLFSNDPFVELSLPPGTYFVAVSPELTVYDAETGTFDLDEDERPETGNYELHVSIENHASDGGNPNNQSVHFDRSVPSGVLSSVPFSLAGYGTNDLPRLYFNYFYDPGPSDSISIRATSDQNPGGVTLATNLQGETLRNVWRQEILPLGQLAGQTGIVVEFSYSVGGGAGAAEGLYLDDFLVGFAERGETITGAALGETGVGGTSSTSPGEYQLELRPATEYATPNGGGIVLDTTFDTNARQIEAATIIAPYADQISDGDTFVLNDGVRSVTFEFDLDSSVRGGNIRVAYTETSSRSEIADAIRTAINLPVVQATLQIQASDSTGSADGGFNDAQVAISGSLFGDFVELERAEDVAPSGMPIDPGSDAFRLPVVFNQGFGDSNVERPQGQLLIESNSISHVRGIGIWNEPGDRETDPEDPNERYLDRAPLGSTHPGAVRNLPTLNNEVIGGTTPGIVVRSNTINQAGYAGIKIDGEIRPFVIDSFETGLNTFLFGDLISDGLTMTIDAADTRVVFEFEDIGGDATTAGGSGAIGGNGFADGHVPIYFRRSNGTVYNGRTSAHTRHEVMLAIYDAIQSSILVTNGIVPLVRTTLGTSLRSDDDFFGSIFDDELATTNAAVYIEGATQIEFSFAFLNPPEVPALIPFFTELAPVHESPQPIARIVNNTIYGNDGRASLFPDNPNNEPNDLLVDAVDPRIGSAHTGPFIAATAINNASDVDLYRVNLGAGDRLVVDIDTIDGGPDTTLRLFDANGVELLINEEALVVDHLETATDPANLDSATVSEIDPSIDFTARLEGLYYVGVSSSGNQSYDANSLSGRVDGVGGVGAYSIAMETYAPRNFVLYVDNGSEESFPQANQGFNGSDLVGTTFTITQIPDRDDSTVQGPTNRLTFTFNAGAGDPRRPDGSVNVPIRGGEDFRVSDLTRAIANAINGTGFVDSATFTNPPLPNHRFNNGPDDLSGPVQEVFASALGGADGSGAGIRTFPTTGDFNTPFGHNRTNQVNSSGFGGTTTFGNGVSELYVLVERAAEIEISTEAAEAGLRLGNAADQNFDQLIPEKGILFAGGSSGTVINNVFANLHQAVVVEETRFGGFGTTNSPIEHPKALPSDTVVTANVFQHIEPDNSSFREEMTQPFSVSGSIGITPGPSNVNGGSDDFNVTLGNNESLFVNPEGGNFLPTSNSIVIDSSVNSVTGRDHVSDLRQSIGLPVSNVLAPDRDVNGVLRADNPDVAPPGGLGSQVFKDRGSNELADFVGPVAIINIPLDNDSDGVDSDPNTSFLRLDEGSYQEFRIQLRDTGDSSDPFAGLGVDDDTVVVASIEDLRRPGANVTLFENERLLEEGIDYTFSYDKTQNVITLTPLSGVWRNDRAYRIQFNNQDRNVLVAPDPTQLSDGDQLSISDDNGGTLVFEFEQGYSLFVPEPITLIVPEVGTNAGGLADGDVFQVNDGVNPVVVFEFDDDDVTLQNTIPIALPSQAPPADQAEREVYLNDLARSIARAIEAQVDAGVLEVGTDDNDDNNADVEVIDNRIIIGAERGATVDTSGSGLTQAERTLALSLPAAGVGALGVRDADRFTVSDGVRSLTFEFDTGNGGTGNNALIPVTPAMSSDEVALAVRDAINQSTLGLTPLVVASGPNQPGAAVFFGLPSGGSASVDEGPLTIVGLSRTPLDGETITITPSGGGTPVVLEINRIDERDASGAVVDDGVAAGNIDVNIDRSNRSIINGVKVDLPAAIAAAIPTLAGLGPNDVNRIDSGLLSITGASDLGLAVSSPTFQVTGSPSVTGASTLDVFGPLLLTLVANGQSTESGSVVVLRDDAGNDVVFEFKNDNDLSPPAIPGSIPVPFDNNSVSDTIANNFVAAINAANIGITAVNTGFARISLGQIDADRVDVNGIAVIDANGQTITAPGLIAASTRRGIVSDGEVVTIQQGGIVVNYEFESAVGGGGVTPGSVQVTFQPGSTIDDVATSLAATINNNKNGLNVDAMAMPNGRVLLNDQPGTIVDISQSSTLRLSGVPGGARPVLFSPAFSATEVKLALIDAINLLNEQSPGVTTLGASDRGGATFFVSGATTISGPVGNFSLPAIADVVGNPLKPNRDDRTTQFTILLADVGLDYGDAPDPQKGVAGRYPTKFDSNGARHVVDNQLILGTSVDTNLDGLPTPSANGDDNTIFASEVGDLFTVSRVDGSAKIDFDASIALNSDGSTITIDTGVATATLEFDLNGRFDEDNFAISPVGPLTDAAIAGAIRDAIIESPLNPASIRIDGASVFVDSDDEDGVDFTSEANPLGVLNRGMALPIDVTVTGAGVLEAWIDFNADGDWDDPGEQIIPMSNEPGLVARREELCSDSDVQSNLFFADDGGATTQTYCIVVPPTIPEPSEIGQTYARFRVSREGGLFPTGLALSGEVEDYALTLLPGTPPQIVEPNRSYTFKENAPSQAIDSDGTLTPTTNDNGLLVGVVDGDGNPVIDVERNIRSASIFAEDTGERELTIGTMEVGTLDLEDDGTFEFTSKPDFNGPVTFTARVTDGALVNSSPITVTINVTPVNDKPFATVNDVIVTRTIEEDAVTVFSVDPTTDGTVTLDGLIGDKYSPGPANEQDQPLIILSVFSSINGSNLSTLGGSLSISNDGRSVQYTPPTDYNGTTADTFNYIVADVPGAGQTSAQADKVGTVSISFTAVNDPPRATDDSYDGVEDESLTIPVRRNATAEGILDDDFAGPADEVAAGQTVSLVTSVFPVTSTAGATITLDGDNLVYTPVPFFSGVDTFDYTITDGESQATGTVFVNIGGDNDAPQFIGINGVAGDESIERLESKTQVEQVTYDLNTWFSDPESNPMTFEVVSDNPSVVSVSRTGNILTLTYPLFGGASEPAILSVTAIDSNQARTTKLIPVTVEDTPDPPRVTGTLNPLTGVEDRAVVADLGGIFSDPDGGQLEFSVARLGNIVNPSVSQIASHPLIQSISFAGNQLRIQLKPDQFGTADVEIGAFDGSFRVSDEFTLTVSSTPDNPVAVADSYLVPVGGELNIVNSASGLLRNDSDADGESFLVDLNNVVGPQNGTLTLNPNGTFRYVSADGTIGATESFTYRLIDASGRNSNTVTVDFTLTQSRYQNPIVGLEQDVNADGVITALDALRVINFVGRNDGAGIPVNQIGAPPPDYYDANGDGTITIGDALNVINRLAGLSAQPVNAEAAQAVTTGFASATVAGMPSRQLQRVTETVSGNLDPRDQLLAGGFEISSAVADQAVSSIASETSDATDPTSVDNALALVLDEFSLDTELS